MDDYHEVTAELDAREVLRYLNYLGIQNISGEVLKYFITDLKKLIKYDLQQKSEKEDGGKEFELQWPERLYSASTFSSRIKSKNQEGIISDCRRNCQRTRKPLHIRNIHSAPDLGKKNRDDGPMRRACSCVRVEKKTELVPKENRLTSHSTNLIKVQKQPLIKKSDPVSLYHYYTSLWAKYKPNVPGENNWSDLRWSIRQKMAGFGNQVLNKVPESTSEKVPLTKS